MPNAKDATVEDVGKHKILLVGSTGSGKTSQLLTLPGKTFAYLFDPSALATLKGYDIEYEQFVFGKGRLEAVSLSKGKSDAAKAESDAHEVYHEWAQDCDNKIESGYFDKFDNIGFDSFTTFSDIVMERVMFLNGRVGQQPQQDDWAAQMQTIANVVKTFASMNKILLFTAHDEFKQDEATHRMQNVILLTGRLRVKVPLLFSEILHTECVSTPELIKYQVQTRPDRMNPAIRCTIKGLDMFQDVTIENWKNPQNYGIGKLLRSQAT